MRAISVDHWMEPADLRVSDVPEPVTPPGGLKLEVRAAGCNFFDILMVQGKYQVRPPFPFIPGAEVAGIVSELGEGVEGFSIGESVFGSAGLGGFAEYTVLPATLAHRMPEGMSFDQAAAFPMVYPTSYAGLVYRGQLRAGENLLVHAAAGGVGLAAVQIGRALGARVIATAGGPEKLEIARSHGADEVIDYREEDFVARVKELTGGNGADVIYDSVGGDVFDRSLKCIAWNGRLVVVGFAGGTIPEVRANRILLKNISVTGLHWGAYQTHQPEKVAETFAALFEMVRQGQVAPLIYRTYALDDVASALGDLASRKTFGKLIVAP